jgi:hypothetical protein
MNSRSVIAFLILALFGFTAASPPSFAQTPAADPSREELQRRVVQLETQMEAMRDELMKLKSALSGDKSPSDGGAPGSANAGSTKTDAATAPNAAGQAAVFLAQTARRVYMLVRSSGLAESMSRYLIRRIEESPTIILPTHPELTALEGSDHLERVSWRENQTGLCSGHGTARLARGKLPPPGQIQFSICTAVLW